MLYVSFRYEFDVTKCMFSAGNITEKLRVSQFDCRGETVVDLYAGEMILCFFFIIIVFPETAKGNKWHKSEIMQSAAALILDQMWHDVTQ